MADWKVVIPARHGSTRLPGKALVDIGGRPMIVHTCQRAAASGAQQVVVATDDQRIQQVVEAAGYDVVMTDPALPSGTDRIWAATEALGWDDEVIVVNVQGDEPGMPAAVINQVAALLASLPGVAAATVAEPITAAEVLNRPAAVKVVVAATGMALYFSRAPVPWDRDRFPATTDTDLAAGGWRRHIGLYAYRVATLRRFVELAPAALEQVEKLEQLRLLANGYGIAVADVCEPVPPGVDTPEDLERFRALSMG